MPAPATAATELPVVEIFSSLQGEGLLIGCRQIFIRCAGCQLDCVYCDTDVEPRDNCRIETAPGSNGFRHLPNPLDLDTVTELVADWERLLPHHSVSITGGEPLLHAQQLTAWLPALRRRLPVMLETNGLLADDLDAILPHVDFISVDIKLPSVSGHEGLWPAHSRFLRRLGDTDGQVKIVVSHQANSAEITQAARTASEDAPRLPLILQPETRAGAPTVSGELLLEWQQLAGRNHHDVRVIPQVHPLLDLL